MLSHEIKLKATLLLLP